MEQPKEIKPVQDLSGNSGTSWYKLGTAFVVGGALVAASWITECQTRKITSLNETDTIDVFLDDTVWTDDAKTNFSEIKQDTARFNLNKDKEINVDGKDDVDFKYDLKDNGFAWTDGDLTLKFENGKLAWSKNGFGPDIGGDYDGSVDFSKDRLRTSGNHNFNLTEKYSSKKCPKQVECGPTNEAIEGRVSSLEKQLTKCGQDLKRAQANSRNAVEAANKWKVYSDQLAKAKNILSRAQQQLLAEKQAAIKSLGLHNLGTDLGSKVILAKQKFGTSVYAISPEIKGQTDEKVIGEAVFSTLGKIYCINMEAIGNKEILENEKKQLISYFSVSDNLSGQGSSSNMTIEQAIRAANAAASMRDEVKDKVTSIRKEDKAFYSGLANGVKYNPTEAITLWKQSDASLVDVSKGIGQLRTKYFLYYPDIN